jgi:hypothetical protein
MATYSIKIVTGSVKNAGTDANVFLTAEGTNGSKTWKNLNDPNDSNDFEKGDVNVIVVTSSTDLGDIKKITIGHDDKGAGSGWYVNSVQITNTATGKQWYFALNRWLAKDEGDKKIKVTVAPTSVTPDKPKDPNTQESLLSKIEDWSNRRTSSAWTGISKKDIAEGLKQIVNYYFGTSKKYTVFRVCDGNSNRTDYFTGVDQGSGFSICGPVAAMFYLAKYNMNTFVDVTTTLYEYGTLLTYRVPERLRTLKDNSKVKSLYKCYPSVVAGVCWMFQASLAQKEAISDVDFGSSCVTTHTRPNEMFSDVKFLFGSKDVKKQGLTSWITVGYAKDNLKEWINYLKKSGTVFWCMHATVLKNLRNGENESYSHAGITDLHWVVVLGIQKTTSGVTFDLHSWGKLYRITVSYDEFQKMSYSAILLKA